MNTDLLFTRLEKLIILTGDQKTFFSGILRERKLKKRQFALHEGAVERCSFFVVEGMLVSYYTDIDGREHIVQFAPEGWWISDLNSFTRQTPARFNIQAVEDSLLLELPFEHTREMFEKLPQMDRYFRIITESAFISFQERIIENNSMEAKERLIAFQQKYGHYQLRIPQKLIASYLGITPEFLSKVRKQLQSSGNPGTINSSGQNSKKGKD